MIELFFRNKKVIKILFFFILYFIDFLNQFILFFYYLNNINQFLLLFSIQIYILITTNIKSSSTPQTLNKMNIINKSKLVRDTCNWVFSQSKYIKFNQQKLQVLASKFGYTQFNNFQHHVLEQNKQKDQHILLYLFTLDSLNFCFWPLQGFQYENLANSVKKYIEKQNGLQKLSKITEQQLNIQIFSGIKVPLADQRARILRQMANVIIHKFNGNISSLINKANKSSINLLNILTQNFPNFQDHSIYKGHQIHFYKRSQILIGDIYAKYQGKNYGQFYDIQQLTMFPDYRVPQILNNYGVLQYSQLLNQKIKNKQEILSGSELEIQIRAASVIAVQKIKFYLKNKGRIVNSIQVDWFLWEEGQKNLKNIVNHHRTMTIYY